MEAVGAIPDRSNNSLFFEEAKGFLFFVQYRAEFQSTRNGRASPCVRRSLSVIFVGNWPGLERRKKGKVESTVLSFPTLFLLPRSRSSSTIAVDNALMSSLSKWKVKAPSFSGRDWIFSIFTVF